MLALWPATAGFKQQSMLQIDRSFGQPAGRAAPACCKSTVPSASRPAEQRQHVANRPFLRPAGRPSSASMLQIDRCFGQPACRSKGRSETCLRLSAGRPAEATVDLRHACACRPAGRPQQRSKPSKKPWLSAGFLLRTMVLSRIFAENHQ